MTIAPQAERLSGLRLVLQGTNLFRVQVVYRGDPGEFVVGGPGNEVLLANPPRARRGLWEHLLHWINRIFSVFGLGEPQALSQKYVNEVRRGEAHLSDPRCIVPAIAEHGASVCCTPEGYEVTISAGTPSGESLEVVFQVRVVANRWQETVLVTSCRLGPAHRDRYPAALALNHRFRIGQVAVVTDVGTKEESFAVVDRRPYETIDPAQYACILLDLSHEILRLRAERVLY